MKDLTLENYYKAMYLFMYRLYKMTGSDDLAGFLGSMSLLEDGRPVDSAIWDDWVGAVNDSLKCESLDEFMKLTFIADEKLPNSADL